MADQKPSGGGGSTPPSNPKWKQLLTRGAVQGFNKFRRPLARLAVKLFLKPEQIAWIAAHENEIDSANTIISTATPSEGLWELTDDFQQDFVHEVILVCKEEMSGAPTTGGTATGTTSDAPTAALPVFNETLKRGRLVNAMAKLADPRQFDDWFGNLAKDDQERFLRHIARISDADLTLLLAKDPLDLGVLLPRLPALPTAPVPPPPRLTYPQLRAAVGTSDALKDKVKTFLTATKTDENRFWECVEQRHISTLDEFRAVMALPDDKVINYLGVVPLSRKVKGWWNTNAKPTINRAMADANQAAKWVGQAVDRTDQSAAIKKLEGHSSAFLNRWQTKLNNRKK